MTEEEWVTAGYGVHYTFQHLGARRIRLLSSAACRALGPAVETPVATAALECNDSYADAAVTTSDLRFMRKRVTAAFQRKIQGPDFVSAFDRHKALRAVKTAISDGNYRHTVWEVAEILHQRERVPFSVALRRLYVWYAEIAGPASGMPMFCDGWKTTNTIGLATAMYETRDFGPMPVLADALEESGCNDPAILGHCRDPNGTHVRGCWVVDLVLGKT